MQEVIARGVVSWNTLDGVVSGGALEFGRLAVDVGENTLLAAELRLWGVSLGDFTTLRIGSSPDGSSGGELEIQDIVGPENAASASISFPRADRFLTITAIVAEDQQGTAECKFAVLA